MEKIIVAIPKELSDYIESLMYEVNARKDLLAFCMSRDIGMDNTMFKKYHDEYIEYSIKYDTAREELSNNYIRKSFPNCNWTLDFYTNSIIVEVLE